MFTYTMQNIFENYIVSKKGLIKVWTWFFQLQLPSSSVRPDFSHAAKKMKTYKYFFKDILFHWIEKKNHMDKFLMQNTFKFLEDVQ